MKAIDRFKHIETIKLPLNLDYSLINGLRHESAEKLSYLKPRTLGQASRISGVNPADISVLMVYLQTNSKPLI